MLCEVLINHGLGPDDELALGGPITEGDVRCLWDIRREIQQCRLHRNHDCQARPFSARQSAGRPPRELHTGMGPKAW